ncbi:hypothetical protein JTB14_032042 [Gonioctena quinquepunctata]|nr:hypothetical protein JTB14_032042 [Gonioctena quinquepunctata]
MQRKHPLVKLTGEGMEGKTLTKSLLPAEFEEIYNETKMVMRNVKAVTLTTDCWTSFTTENFLAVTAYFLSDDFVMKQMVLGCESFGERHTGGNLGDAIKKIIDVWGLKDRNFNGRFG